MEIRPQRHGVTKSKLAYSGTIENPETPRLRVSMVD
jgi:hypothetical protein